MLTRFTTKAGDKAKPDKVSLVITELPMCCKSVTRFQDNILRLKGTCPSVDDMDADLDEYLMDNHEAATDMLEEKTKHWDGTLDAHMVKRIECLTGCSISQKLDGPGLLVKGATFSDIERAIVKLDVISSMMVSSLLILMYWEIE